VHSALPAAPAQPAASPRYALAAEYSAARAGHVLLIVEGEEVALEAGQNGHEPLEPHPLHDGTNSFWGVLAVAADSDGLLDLDEPVRFTLPEFDADPRKRELRIRHLLQFTSGLESGFHTLRREAPANAYQRALFLEMVSSPGERFQYGPSHLFVFGEVLRRKLEARGEDPLGYLRHRILDPIGAEITDWDRDPEGNPDLPSGATLTARDWAKFGILVKDGGRWRGETIVDPEALAACFEGSEASATYGLTFWLNHTKPRSAEGDSGGERRGGRVSEPVFYPNGLSDMVVAAGAGNQRLYVIPSLDVVVVRFGGLDRRWRDEAFLERIVEASAGR
jgi:CubicO group peptidase (beta-lactamase class C family)